MTNEEKNEFDNLDVEDDVPEQVFNDVPGATEKEVLGSDIMRENYIKNPEPGNFILLKVDKVVDSTKTKGVNNTTGEEFTIGLKKKDGTVVRRDIITSEGRYTVTSWEVFFKLFAKDGVLVDYVKNNNNSFKGAVLKITKHYDGSYAMKKIKEIAKLLDISEDEAEEYKKTVAQAIKDKKLYSVELIGEGCTI